MNNRSCLIIFFLFSFLQSIFASLIGEGEAHIFRDQIHKARRQAFQNAKNDILLQVIQKKLTKQSIDNNWDLLRKDIFANTNKYLRRINILSDKQKGNSYFFRIQAEVLTKNIDSYLQKFFKVSNKKRIFVLYFPGIESYSINRSEVRHLFQNLQNSYTKINFEQDIYLNKIWSEEKLLLDHSIISKASADEDQKEKLKEKKKILLDSILYNLNLDGYQAAVFIDMALLKNKLDDDTRFVFRKKNVVLDIQIYDLDIGLIKEKNIIFPFVSNDKRDGMGVALTDIIAQASDLFASFLDDYFGSYYFEWESKKYDIAFNNFNQLEEQGIKDTLINLTGYQNIFSQRSRNKLKISYYSSLSSERIYQLINFTLKEVEINALLQSRSYDIMSFNKISNVK